MYWKRRNFVLNSELYGTIRPMNATCRKTVRIVQRKRRNGLCIYCILSVKGVVDTK